MSSERITGITVAAGLSTRFPGNKLLYNLEGKPLVSWTVNKLLNAGVDKLVVVLGNRAVDIMKAVLDNAVDPSRIFFAYNPEYATSGMSSSIKAGLKLVCEGEHILIHPADIPCLRTSSIRKVIEAHYSSTNPITVACYNGRKSHPIIFKPHLLSDLKSIREETFGLKSVVNKYREQILCVETRDPGTLRDIDTPEDLELCIKRNLFE